MKLTLALFLVALGTSTVYADDGEGEEPPMSLAEEYVDFLQGGGGGGGGGEGGSCGGGGSEDGGSEDEGGEGMEDVNTLPINLGAILLKDFRSGYEKLSAEDAKKKLRDYLPNIDSDKDGFLDATEIKSWVFDQGKQHSDTLETDELGWAAVQDGTHYSWEQMLKDLKAPDNQISPFTAEEEAREKAKFDAADTDKDGRLSKQEYRGYAFPELFDHMAEYVRSSTVKDFDKDNDGKITAEEYDKVMESFAPSTKEESKFPKLDSNGDGVISGDDEIKNLIDDYSLVSSLEEEAKNFVAKADSDKDGKVSYDEVAANYELFLSPQVGANAQVPETLTQDQNEEGNKKDEL